MPDEDGRLTEGESKYLMRHLRDLTRETSCPWCSANTWILMSHVLYAPVHRENRFPLTGGAKYPLIGVACTNCGYVRFHSAVLAGIFNDQGQIIERP